MNILFIGYWGINDGLTSSTIIPHLKILSQYADVNKIIFCTIERSGDKTSLDLEKVKHVPLFAKNYGSVFINKVNDFIRFPKVLIQICKADKIDLLICRSSLAGALGYLVWRKNRIPYIVESFEPHAGYMIDSGTWTFYDPRYVIQQYFEKKQKQTAKYLLPVSENYAKRLVDEKVDPEKVKTMPCCVSIRDFAFDNNRRIIQRKASGIAEDTIVGIYVGKYGDIYYDEEAFDLYKKAFLFFGEKFKLIILSADPLSVIQLKLQERKIPLDRVLILTVPHHAVSHYLSAADFAFSTIKPSPFRKFCSPVKNGEYWANGLPILTEYGIGDDSDIILREGGGVLLNMSAPEQSFEEILKMVAIGRQPMAEKIQGIAYRHRRMEIVEQTYKGMIQEFLSCN